MQLRKLGIALAATVAIGLASAAPASAQHHWHHHGGGGWGGFGPGFVGGLALGAAVGGPYYGYGYAPYSYGYGPYAYAGDCYIRRRVVINRFGERIVRRVRVCD
jgi:hypothetical protein